MFYTYEYAGQTGVHRLQFNPERIEVKLRDNQSISVMPTTQQKRMELLDYLDDQGFKPDSEWRRTRDEVLESPYPVSIHLGKKTYTHVGNTTCAAAAVSQKIVTPEELFYRLHHNEG